MVDTGYQPRRESLSICAPGVAVIGAHCLGEISFIIGADSCSGFAYGRIGPFWGGVFGTSSIIKGSGFTMAFIMADSFADFPLNCHFCGRVFAVHATSSVTKRSVVLEEVPICVCPNS